ncbi:MAG: TaqI-like C-terminal specificity domain-containing protein [Planctomycetota bacterium]
MEPALPAPLTGEGTPATPPLLAARAARGLFEGPARAEPPRILDPACGEGALLVAAWVAAGRSESFAREGLFGIELDPARAARARARLRAAIGGAAGRRAAQHVALGDSLDPARPWPAKTAVLANPPWVSFAGREAGTIDSDRRAALGRAWPTIRPWPSLHGAFLERIARHVAQERTRACVFLPASVAHLPAYGRGRRLVTALCRLEAPPVELGEDSFPGVVEPAVLVALVARSPAGEGSDAPWGLRDPAEERWVAHLAAFPTLPPGSFRDPGVHTGNAAAELVVRGDGSDLPGLREGRDLAPYRLAPPAAWLRVDLPREAGRRFRIAPLARYASFPLLVRQTADRPLAALHTAPTYFRNSLLACAPPPELDPAFVVGVLNSAVAARWHRLRHADARQRAFPQVKVAHLAALPFPIARRGDDPGLHDRIAAAVRALTDRPDPPAALFCRVDELVAAAFR